MRWVMFNLHSFNGTIEQGTYRRKWIGYYLEDVYLRNIDRDVTSCDNKSKRSLQLSFLSACICVNSSSQTRYCYIEGIEPPLKLFKNTLNVENMFISRTMMKNAMVSFKKLIILLPLSWDFSFLLTVILNKNGYSLSSSWLL